MNYHHSRLHSKLAACPFAVETLTIENAETLIEVITEHYAWTMDTMSICIRDAECVSFDWLDWNLYICVYNDSVCIDLCTLVKGQVIHKGRELQVTSAQSIRDAFRYKFEDVLGRKEK